MKKNLFKQFLSFSYGSWIGLVIGILGTIISTRILSPEDFGIASMFTMALNIALIIIMFGTDQSFVRFFYEEEADKRGGLLYNCIKFPILFSVIVAFLVMVFNNKISIFLFGEENLAVIIMLVIGIFIQVFDKYGILVIRMEQKGNLFSLLEIINRTLGLILLISLYFLMGSNYEIIIFSTVVNILIMSIIYVFLVKKYWSLRNINMKGLVHSKSDVLTYGSPLVLTLLITFLFQAFDKIAIKQWSTYEELGLYAAAFKIVALVNVLQMNFSAFWTPICYENYEKNPNNRKFYEEMTGIVSYVMFFIAILSIAGKDITVFLLGENYRESANLMPFLVFMPVMYTISETTVIGINFYKKPKWHILVASVSCIVNILGNWLLVPKFGAVGASISTAFSYVIFFSLRTHISLKYYKVNYGLKKIYSMILIISLYATFSILTSSVITNMFMGIIVVLVLTLLYRSELVRLLYYVKSKNVFRFLKT